MLDRNGKPPVIGRGLNVQVVEAGNAVHSATHGRQVWQSDTIEQAIGQATVALMVGEIELWQLPDSLAELYYFAYEDGRATANRAELEQLRWERDLFYFVSCNPGKRPGDFYGHATSQLWAEAVSHD